MQTMSERFFALAAAAYFFAALIHIVSISSGKTGLRKVAFWVTSGGFLAQTLGLAARYIAAGQVEVSAFEKATGNVLTGWERISVFLSHPPFTNLYESMVFMVWGLILVSLYIERKGRYPIIGLFSTALAVLALGLSSLMTDNTITPLVPALQSWWLHAHVAMAATAYGAFLLAAILSFLFLVKDGVETRTIGLTLSVVAALMLFGLARGTPVFNGDYFLTLLSKNGGKVSQVWFEALGGAGPAEMPAKIPAGRTGVLISVTFALYLAAAISYAVLKTGTRSKTGLFLYITAFAALSATLTSFLTDVLGGLIVTSPEDLKTLIASSYGSVGVGRISGAAPYYLGMKSNPYDFSLLVFLWLLAASTIYISLRKERITESLPDAKALDMAAYRVTMFAFPMMSLVIITGAVWAHYAWGRYWGWDPKETWSLITWFLYAFYLYARITHGWTGRRSAVISVIGFAVVIFTYLGVNLGLTGSGLHVYGRG